jgi:hypothetical protein
LFILSLSLSAASLSLVSCSFFFSSTFLASSSSYFLLIAAISNLPCSNTEVLSLIPAFSNANNLSF